MRIIILLALVLTLTGCVTDDTMSKPLQLDSNFNFDQQLVHVEVGRKEIAFNNSISIYRLLTTSEQAAYLLSGERLLDYYINDVQIKDVDLSLKNLSPISSEEVYEVFMHFTLTDDELKKLGDKLTSIKIAYNDKTVFRYEHSPVYYDVHVKSFEIVGMEEDLGILLKNWTNKDYDFKQIYVEDSSNKRITIMDAPFSFKNLDEITLPFTPNIAEEKQLEGAMAIFALTIDGQEILIGGVPFINEPLYEQRIKEFEERIESNK